MGALSVDTNIIVYSLNRDSEMHGAAREFLAGIAPRNDVVICELVLVEVYLLIRNQAVFERPFGAAQAAAACRHLRANPRWRVVECRPVMDEVWKRVAGDDFARRGVIDVRLGLTLAAAGVTEFATRNVSDFEGLGIARVFDPLQRATVLKQL
jgi:uncharacterized protein